jgi:hypothetical protein
MLNVIRSHLNFLGLTGLQVGYLASLRQQCFSTSSTPSQEYKEDRIAGKSELSLALDNGDSHTPVVGESVENKEESDSV